MAIGPTGVGIWFTIIKNIVLLVVGSLALTVISKSFKTKDTSFLTALKVNLVIVVISFVLGLIMQALQNPTNPNVYLQLFNFVLYYAIYVVLALYLIRKFYNVNMTEATAMWILFMLTYLILYLLFSVIQFSIQMASLSQSMGQMQIQPGAGAQMPAGQPMPMQGQMPAPSSGEGSELFIPDQVNPETPE